jgi:ABC-type multidrug transport system fused ATPase/permease subunit
MGLVTKLTAKYSKATLTSCQHFLQPLRGKLVAVAVFRYLSLGYWGLAFWFAGYVVIEGQCTVVDALRALACIVVSANFAGIYAASMPRLDLAGQYARTLRSMLANDSVSNIKLGSIKSSSKPLLSMNGKVEFRNVNFSYPSRPKARVLNNLSFCIPAGATAAFVGGSGSGLHLVLRHAIIS